MNSFYGNPFVDRSFSDRAKNYDEHYTVRPDGTFELASQVFFPVRRASSRQLRSRNSSGLGARECVLL
jgi:hypothetical protein